MLTGAMPGESDRPRVFLVGDSTMSEKEMVGTAERGWGQPFAQFFTEPAIVRNHARNGRSTKSFMDEGRWDVVMSELRPGDYVLIQFGHNDAKNDDPTRFADAQTDYKRNLTKFVMDTRSKGGHPVLITPVCRRRFNARGEFYDVHGNYPDVVRAVGKDMQVTVLDLHKKSMDLLATLGEQRSKGLFLHAIQGEYSAFPEGKRDDTHFNPAGAREIATLVVKALREAGHPLTAHMTDGQPPFAGEGKTVMLDCFYNNEWCTDAQGRRGRYHYTWNDTTNSGFSSLGRIITATGAVIDTLPTKPISENLRYTDIYIIVDPDTPEETEQPNFLDVSAIETIVDWVDNGGTLVLLGNDKGKAEFTHFNTLAGRFGIQFNEDSRNPATSKDFTGATFTNFPAHPIFDNVRRVFIKELSTLTLREPAVPLFTDGGDIIIGFARYGRGSVLAVGDPWFYNEYMGTWRLPEGYDNPTAARNLFSWLLEGVRR